MLMGLKGLERAFGLLFLFFLHYLFIWIQVFLLLAEPVGKPHLFGQ
jgi:hypothetical protein